MNVSFVKPSNNYNIIITPEELNLLRDGKCLLIRPTRTDTKYVDMSGLPEGKEKSKFTGHALTIDAPDFNSYVQFVTVSVDFRDTPKILKQENNHLRTRVYDCCGSTIEYNVNDVKLHSSYEDGLGGNEFCKSIDCPNCNCRIVWNV